MRVLPITLLVTTVLGSIGLAGCQTTEDDYYYGDRPQRRVVRTYEDDTVYVRRPNWRYVDDRPTRVVTPPPRWTPRDEPRPVRWEHPRPPVVHAPPPPPVVHAPPNGMGGHRPPPPDDRRRHWPDGEQAPVHGKPQ